MVGPEQNCSKIEFLTTSGPIMTVCISRINFQRGRPMSTIFYDSLTKVLGFFCVKGVSYKILEAVDHFHGPF